MHVGGRRARARANIDERQAPAEDPSQRGAGALLLVSRPASKATPLTPLLPSLFYPLGHKIREKKLEKEIQRLQENLAEEKKKARLLPAPARIYSRTS